MGAITPEFLMDLESRMQVVTENEYLRLASNVWWPLVMKKRPTGSRREILAWLISTAMIEDIGPKGGKLGYDEILSKTMEIETTFAGKGLKLHRAQLEDTDGNGVDLAVKWSGDIGAYMGYWPQKKATYILKNGHTTTTPATVAYDGLSFFNAAHFVNAIDATAGTYANIFTGAPAAASGLTPAYPGTCPIDDSVSVDTALTNLSKVVAYIKSIKMPNGEDPRFLRPTQLIVPPRMQQRATQLTNAKFIAQSAGGGSAGSGDVEKVIASFGFTQPTVADELAGFESDTTCFLVCEQMSESQLGGIVYVEREAFSITYYTGQTLPDFRRNQELEWITQGRYGVQVGHPFTIFKLKGT
jgi:hypothetical protein